MTRQGGLLFLGNRILLYESQHTKSNLRRQPHSGFCFSCQASALRTTCISDPRNTVQDPQTLALTQGEGEEAGARSCGPSHPGSKILCSPGTGALGVTILQPGLYLGTSSSQSFSQRLRPDPGAVLGSLGTSCEYHPKEDEMVLWIFRKSRLWVLSPGRQETYRMGQVGHWGPREHILHLLFQSLLEPGAPAPLKGHVTA